MDSKGLGVCHSLERDKSCWRCCCRHGSDGRKEACHNGLDSLTYGLRTLQAAPVTSSVFCDKTGRGSSNMTCIKFGCLSNHVPLWKGQYSFEAQCSLPCLTAQSAASAHHKQISLCLTKVH